MNPRIRAVLQKEFREYRRNRLIVLTMLLLPALLIVPILIGLLAIPETGSPGLVGALVNQVMLYFLLVPALLPTVISSYAVIGEREQGTLEPVLATPLTDQELLLGKAAAAAVPGVLLAWTLFVVSLISLALFAAPVVRSEAFQARHLVAQALVGPTLAVYSIEVGMAISSRSTDIRVAQQLSGLAVLPVVGVLSLLTFHVIEPTVARYAIAAAILVLVDVLGWRVLTRLFDRERVLTRFGG